MLRIRYQLSDGNEAAAEAARRAAKSQAQGDLSGRDKWLLVGKVVHAMKSTRQRFPPNRVKPGALRHVLPELPTVASRPDATLMENRKLLEEFE